MGESDHDRMGAGSAPRGTRRAVGCASGAHSTHAIATGTRRSGRSAPARGTARPRGPRPEASSRRCPESGVLVALPLGSGAVRRWSRSAPPRSSTRRRRRCSRRSDRRSGRARIPVAPGGSAGSRSGRRLSQRSSEGQRSRRAAPRSRRAARNGRRRTAGRPRTPPRSSRRASACSTSHPGCLVLHATAARRRGRVCADARATLQRRSTPEALVRFGSSIDPILPCVRRSWGDNAVRTPPCLG